MASITLYIPDDKMEAVKRAKKLAAFHEDKSLSALFLETCEQVINRHEPPAIIGGKADRS